MSLRALYVDFNSYFASVERQPRPELRGKLIGVLPVLAETTLETYQLNAALGALNLRFGKILYILAELRQH